MAMREPQWLIEQFSEARCALCGARYGADAIHVLGSEDGYWFVQAICPACGTQGLGVAVAREEEPAGVPGRRRPITSDEVIDAHDLLKRHHGDIHALFASRRVA